MASPPKTPAAFCCWLVWSSWACSDGLETRVGVVVFRECKYFKYQLCLVENFVIMFSCASSAWFGSETIASLIWKWKFYVDGD